MAIDSEPSGIRPIFYSFNPADQRSGPPTNNFAFLDAQPASGERDGSNRFNLPVIGVPWPTSFPVAVQCRQWKEAEAAAKQLMADVLSVLPQDHGLTKLKGHSSLAQMSNYNELIETGVSASINDFSASNPRRAEIMAKANLLIFISDDIVEAGLVDGVSIIDEALADLRINSVPHEEEAQIWQNRFAMEIFEEDPANAKEFLGGMLRWVQHIRVNPPKEQAEFASFADYMRYRIEDFSVEWVEASLKFTCEVTLSTSELEALAPARHLYMTHISLTNDLSSYPNELLEMKEGGALINGVHDLQTLLAVCPNTAKMNLRHILWSIESQFDQMYKDFEQFGKFSEGQLRLF